MGRFALFIILCTLSNVRYTGKNILVVTGMMNVGIIAGIADHKTVEKISGTANAVFY